MMSDTEFNQIKARVKEMRELNSPEQQIIESKQKIGQIYSREPFLEHLYEEQQYDQLAVIELNTIRRMLELIIPDLKASILQVSNEEDETYQAPPDDSIASIVAPDKAIIRPKPIGKTRGRGMVRS